MRLTYDVVVVRTRPVMIGVTAVVMLRTESDSSGPDAVDTT